MNDELRKKYEDYLKYELNYSLNTIKEYFIHLDKYFIYLKNNNINYLNITKDEVTKYLKYLDDLKLSNKTISNILSSIRTFYDYLLDEKYIELNIFKLIHNPKIEKRLPNFLSHEDLASILDSISCETELDYRNKLIVQMLYSTGVRVSELVNIKIEDINTNTREIRVFGKGRKERIVFYTKSCQNALNNYLNIRSFNSEYLFLNNKGSKITTRGIEKIIDKIVTISCISNHVSPHTFRHTFATHLLNSGADIRSVGELLGHESLNTTEVYTHITSDYLKSEYLKRMPRK